MCPWNSFTYTRHIIYLLRAINNCFYSREVTAPSESKPCHQALEVYVEAFDYLDSCRRTWPCFPNLRVPHYPQVKQRVLGQITWPPVELDCPFAYGSYGSYSHMPIHFRTVYQSAEVSVSTFFLRSFDSIFHEIQASIPQIHVRKISDGPS